jgi:hemerythrin-like domain-containing protein
MTVFDVLDREHKRLLAVLRRLEDASVGEPAQRRSLLREVRDRVRTMTHAERDLLYPLLLEHREARDETVLSLQEDDDIEDQLEALGTLAPDDHVFQRELEVLSGVLRQHIARQRNELLPLAQRVISKAQAQQLGQELGA